MSARTEYPGGESGRESGRTGATPQKRPVGVAGVPGSEDGVPGSEGVAAVVDGKGATGPSGVEMDARGNMMRTGTSSKLEHDAKQFTQSTVMHVLISVPFGRAFLHDEQPTQLRPNFDATANYYILIKVFWLRESLRSQVSWHNTHPDFQFIQVPRRLFAFSFTRKSPRTLFCK